MIPEPDSHIIEIETETQYIPEQSDPSRDLYVFAYHITIRNAGTVGVQLISRHWIITDAHNKVQEVEGSGVIGQQPLIQPGEHFEYTSGCTLATPVGTMQGSYQMVDEHGNGFDAMIPVFVLAMPRVLH